MFMLTKIAVVLATLALAAASPAVLAQSKQSSDKQAASQSQKKGSLAKEDQKRFRDMAQANMAEVEAGKLAQQQARSDAVKKYGEHMVEDHGKMLDEQQQMAQSKGLEMPKQPNKEQQSAMKKLQSAKDGQFDKAFMSQMVKDHEKALKLVRDSAKNAKDPELKAMAQKAEPDIQKHLQMAKQLSDQASAGASAAPKKTSK
jgi:putative membrane protein